MKESATTAAPERLGFSIEEGAGLIGIGRSTAYAEIKAGELETITVGRRRIITAEGLRAYIRRKTDAARAAAPLQARAPPDE